MNAQHEQLTGAVINAAYHVYNTLGGGFLESIYQRALVMTLSKRGLATSEQVPIDVWFEENRIGEFRGDVLVEGTVLIELKAVDRLVKAHEVQLVNYLAATQIDVGLLINFSPTTVQVKRKVRVLPQDAPAAKRPNHVHPVNPVIPSNPSPRTTP